MEKPSEEYIENYVRYPSDLSTKEKRWIEEWIQKDCEVRLLVDWFREFYETVDQIERSKTGSADKPQLIQLNLFEEGKSATGNLIVQKTAFSGEKSAFKTIRTFISEEHKTLIRILHNKDDNRSKLHVISEFIDEGDIVLFKIPGEDILLVSALGGSAPIPDKISPDHMRDWSQCELYLPLTKIHVYRDKRTNHINTDSLGAGKDSSSIDVKVIHQNVEIIIDLPEKPSPQKVVLHSNEASNVWTLEHGVCSIPIKEFSTSGSKLFFFK